MRRALPPMSAELKRRVASAAALVALALVTTWAGGAWFALLWLLAGALTFREWMLMVEGDSRSIAFGVGAATLAAATVLVFADAEEWAALALIAGTAAVAALAGRRGWAALGLVYAGVIALVPDWLRLSVPGGMTAVMWLFAVVWATDICAFFGGRSIGGPRLAPAISPNKTWAGFWTGLAGGTLAGIAALAIAPGLGATPFLNGLSWVGFASSIGGSVVVQGGDLFESWMKRRFGMKDSGALIPGHGGLMDRLDGFAALCAAVALAGAFLHVTGLWRAGGP